MESFRGIITVTIQPSAPIGFSCQFLPKSLSWAMATMNISLPDSLKSFVDQQIVQGTYGSSSEYIRELIRKDQDRTHLRNLVLKGAASAPGPVADATFFEELRARIQTRAKE